MTEIPALLLLSPSFLFFFVISSAKEIIINVLFPDFPK